ncbi:GTP-binding protein [Palleniella muris]|uniref:GTP-binding protein n=1 Tax=Palleniella muris TaxID=3038145 RepID=A0AC61QMF3_9BACT|nr:GTP-binding protein [Palleniella muris]TGX80435.1 GTP-binding protein [Palleniella muris]
MNNITPVLLLTGYLGSGKTTLLNRILSNKKGIKFAVIVNDIGEVNIDADLIQKGGVVGQQDDSLVPLQNGCICCTLKMDLVEQLRDLMKAKKFDYIVIEASGICEPQPIAQTICSIPMMGEEYTTDGEARLDSIVSVVDALRLRDEFNGGLDLTKQNIAEEDIENLVIQQIEFCNIILLNKASEVTPQELGRIREILHTLQPKAQIINCDYCDVDLDMLLNTNSFDFNTLAASPTWVQEVEKHLDEMEEHEEEHEHHHHHEEHHHHHHHDEEHECHHHDHEHKHHHHHGEGCTCGHCHHNEETGEAEEYGIGTFVYYAREPFSITEFDQFVARKWPKSVIRAKGICYFHDEQDTCYVFEQAGKQVSLRNAGQWYATMPADELRTFLADNPGVKRDWDDRYGDRMQKLVFIGQHMNRKEITDMLDACLVK